MRRKKSVAKFSNWLKRWVELRVILETSLGCFEVGQGSPDASSHARKRQLLDYGYLCEVDLLKILDRWREVIKQVLIA